MKWSPFSLMAGFLLATGLFFAYRELAPGPGALHSSFDPPILVKQIQQLRELMSVKYTVQKVVGLEEKKAPLGSERLLLIVQAEVLGGIDLTRFTARDVTKRPDGVLVIALPQPQVLHVIIDDRETKVWDRSITWWTPWVPYNPDLERQARLAARESIQRAALKMGILGDAQRNAETTISALVKALGAESVAFARGT
jgi:hypothetical protein